MPERNWEIPVTVVASLLAVLLLIWAVAHPQPELHEPAGVVFPSWSVATLLAAVFGSTAAVKLRHSTSGRTLALLMSLLATTLAGTLAAPIPYGLGLITLVAFWGVVGATLRLSKCLAGAATAEDLAEARQLTMLATLVRPGLVRWTMDRPAVIWWTFLFIWLVLYGVTWAFGGPSSVNNWAGFVLATLVTVTALLLMGAALSNVAGQAGQLAEDEWRSVRWLLWALLTSVIFAVGSTLGFLAFALNSPVLELISTVLLAAAPLVLVIGVMLAVIGFGVVDPSFALRRTISIALVGLVWIATFATLEELLARSVSDQLQLSETVVSWLIVVGTAAFLAPIQRKLERHLGRSDLTASTRTDEEPN
jgi:hypothetical protein